MHFALGRLLWPPAAFWAATPVEVLAAAPLSSPLAATINREGLSELMTRFPDPAKDDADGNGD